MYPSTLKKIYKLIIYLSEHHWKNHSTSSKNGSVQFMKKSTFYLHPNNQNFLDASEHVEADSDGLL